MKALIFEVHGKDADGKAEVLCQIITLDDLVGELQCTVPPAPAGWVPTKLCVRPLLLERPAAPALPTLHERLEGDARPRRWHHCRLAMCHKAGGCTEVVRCVADAWRICPLSNCHDARRCFYPSACRVP